MQGTDMSSEVMVIIRAVVARPKGKTFECSICHARGLTACVGLSEENPGYDDFFDTFCLDCCTRIEHAACDARKRTEGSGYANALADCDDRSHS